MDDQVTPEMFVGPIPVSSRYDLVLFMGHSSPQGPWLGEGGRSALMRTSNYHWSGGATKWFVNAACSGLFDGRKDGEADEQVLAQGNGGRDAQGHAVPLLGGWGQAMGQTPEVKDRLHAMFAYRSVSWFNWDMKTSIKKGGGLFYMEFSTDGFWQYNPANLFINGLMKPDEGLTHHKIPNRMGDLWMYCANYRYAFSGLTGATPAVYAWVAEKGEGAAKEVIDYYNESFHAPFPSPGRLGPEYKLRLKCRYHKFGTPQF